MKREVRHVWQIVANDGTFHRFLRPAPFTHWYFESRELAETEAALVAKAAHQRLVDDMVERVKDPREGLDDPKVVEWWTNKPPLTIFRNETATAYLVGQPDWDDRDKRGHFFGAIERVEVVVA